VMGNINSHAYPLTNSKISFYKLGMAYIATR